MTARLYDIVRYRPQHETKDAIGWVVGSCRPNGDYLFDVRRREGRNRFALVVELNIPANAVKKVIGSYGNPAEAQEQGTLAS